MKTLIHSFSLLIQIVSLIVFAPFGWLFNSLDLYKVLTGKYTWCFRAFGCNFLPVIQVNSLEYF